MARLDLLHLPNEGVDLTTLADWADVEHIVQIRTLTIEAEIAFCHGRDQAYLDALARLEAEVKDAIAAMGEAGRSQEQGG